MSETAPLTPESNPEQLSGSKPENLEAHQHNANAESDQEYGRTLEHIREEVSAEEAKAKTVELPNLASEDQEKDQSWKPPANKELRGIASRKELKHIRTKLKAPDKVGSKIIHSPLIRTVSEVSAKTISRPSGLLGGGLAAFLGSGLYLYLTKHVGLRYDYLLFAILFVGGFILGLIIETGIYTFSSKKSLK